MWHTPLAQPAGPKPPTPGGGGNGGGNGGGTGGGGGATKDTEAPTTSIAIVGHGYWFTWSGIEYYTGNCTVTLNATDNVDVAHIFLKDNQSSVVLPTPHWSDGGRIAWTSTTITAPGLHVLQYYSTDNSSNVEMAHSATLGIGKPLLSDLASLIVNSGIDNAGIKNALLAKVNAAEGQRSRGLPMNSLNALVNQLNALDGKHGLDNATVTNIEAMVRELLAS